jgi:hypothetical protein
MVIAVFLVEMGKYGINHLTNVHALKILIGMDLFALLVHQVKYGIVDFLHVYVLQILNGMDLIV